MQATSRRLALALLVVTLASTPGRGWQDPSRNPFEFIPLDQQCERVRSRLEKAAVDLESFSARDLCFDSRGAIYAQADYRERHTAAWDSVFEHRIAKYTLTPLLEHEDPRVRTLAAACLFHADDPQYLVHLLPLLEDEAETFPQPAPVSIAVGVEPPERPSVSPRSVGRVVGTFLHFYSDRLGDVESNAEYWERRKDRRHCLSWFDGRLDRVTGGGNVPPFDKRSIESVWGFVGLLPRAEADWTRLAVFHDPHHGQGNVVTSESRIASVLGWIPESELIWAARRRGREALLEVLRGNAPTEDPDWSSYLGRVQHFVLEHAEELLLPRDHAELLRIAESLSTWMVEPARRSLERVERPGEGLAAWYIAAARLAPAKAVEILAAALERSPRESPFFRDSIRLGRELSCLDDQRAADLLIEVFYSDRDGYEKYTQMKLIQFMERQWQARDRETIRRLLADERSEMLDPWTIHAMGVAVNRNRAEPVIDRGELYELYERGEKGTLTTKELLDRWVAASGGSLLPGAGADGHPNRVVEDPVAVIDWDESAATAAPLRCVVDLNRDGREDQIISGPVEGTSSGVRSYSIFLQREDGQYEEIGEIRASAFALERQRDATVLWHRCDGPGGEMTIACSSVDGTGRLESTASLPIRVGAHLPGVGDRILMAIFSSSATLHFEVVER